MTTKNNIRSIYHCDVELLTPLHIGSGDKYVEHFDFSYKRQAQKLTVFNRNKLFEQVAGSGEAGIQAFTRAIEEERLDAWLDSRPEGINMDAARIHSFSCERPPREILVQLRTGTSDALLAGSSLKGSLRTAVLSQLSKEDGRKAIDQFKQKLLAPGLRIKTDDNEIVKQYLGPDAQKNLMRCLSVADCVFPANTIKLENVLLSRRVSNQKMAVKFSVILEKICEGSKAGCQVSFDTYLGQHGQANLGFRADLTLDWMLDAVRRKTAKTIATELDFFDGVGGDHSQMLKSFYEQLQGKIRETGENEVILQLAWGSGWNGMTGELLEKNELTPVLREKLKLAPGYAQFPFPKSRRFALINGQALPMGWVKLSFTDKEEKKRFEAEQRQAALNRQAREDAAQRANEERKEQWLAMDETGQDIAIIQKTDLALEQAPQKEPLKDVWPKLEKSEPDIQKKLAQTFIGEWENIPEAWRKKQCSKSQWEKVEKLVEITGIDHPDILQLDTGEQQFVDTITALKDFGQFCNSNISMDGLTLIAAETLKDKFMEWGCNNKKANPNKSKAWKALDKNLKNLRKKERPGN
mgnify:CR=1 FL=1